MLGNDVVDLLDSDACPETYRAGFDERVFAEEERRGIALDSHPLARRWAHWAAKEAAYKLARQADSSFIFSPGQLVAKFEPVGGFVGRRLERRGHLVLPKKVGQNIRTIKLRSFETAERVHVIAIPENADWGSVDFKLERVGSNPIAASAAVRKMAIREMGRRLGVASERLSIGRRERIPTVELDGITTTLSLSLSHHGEWIGYAMGLQMGVEPKVDPTLKLNSIEATQSNHAWPI